MLVELLWYLKLVSILLPLITKQHPLGHPNRRAIYEHVTEHPGASFREVVRATGVSPGTVRHHIQKLRKARMITEHRWHHTIRLFENHGKFDHDWHRVVLLREPPLRKLHEWLDAQPEIIQKDIVEEAETWGWHRSTTQNRLRRLQHGGLVQVRLSGRSKLYTTRKKSTPPPESIIDPYPFRFTW